MVAECRDNGSIVHWRAVQSKMRSEVQRDGRLAPKLSPVFHGVRGVYVALSFRDDYAYHEVLYASRWPYA